MRFEERTGRWQRVVPGAINAMWFNPFVIWILRSPLHWIFSRQTMLLTYRGRRSRKSYTTPVNFVRVGNILLVASLRSRIWWRNLRGGVPVTVGIQGREIGATGEVFEDDAEVAAGLTSILENAPQYAKYFHVAMDAAGKPNPQDVMRAARDRVLVRICIGIRVKDSVGLPTPVGSWSASSSCFPRIGHLILRTAPPSGRVSGGSVRDRAAEPIVSSRAAIVA